jgi:hypothetical protein
MLAELFQKQYVFEHQRRGELTAATASPIAATTVLSPEFDTFSPIFLNFRVVFF